MFQRDELNEIRQDLIPYMKKEFPKKEHTVENLNEYFLARARKNMHITLCFSPVGNLVAFIDGKMQINIFSSHF